MRSKITGFIGINGLARLIGILFILSFVVNHGDSARTSRDPRSDTLAPRAGDAIHPVLWIQGGVRARLASYFGM